MIADKANVNVMAALVNAKIIYLGVEVWFSLEM